MNVFIPPHNGPVQRGARTSAVDDPSVSQSVFTITEKAPARALSWLVYDFCVGDPISRLLTVGSTPV